MKTKAYIIYFFLALCLIVFSILIAVIQNKSNLNEKKVNVFHEKTQKIINDYNLIGPFHVYSRSTRNSDMVEVIIIGSYPDFMKNSFKDGESGMFISATEYLSSFWQKVESKVYISTILSPSIVYHSTPFVFILKNGNILFFDNNVFIICNYYIKKTELLP